MAESSTLAQRPAMPEGTPAERQRVVRQLNQIPDAQLACRVHHKWPSEDLEVGKPLPKGLTAESTDQRGVYMLLDQCPRCGKIRWKLTRRNGIWPEEGGWHYIDPHNLPGYDDWVKLDQDIKRGTTVMLGENIRRNAKQLFK